MTDPTQTDLKVAALIVAGGKGSRLGGDVPKQYLELSGQSILARTARVFQAHPKVSLLQFVIAEDDYARFEALGLKGDALLPPVIGGVTRQASVFEGLNALAPHAPDVVLIHDAARPFLPASSIDDLLTAIDKSDGAFLAVPVADTLRRTSGENALETVDRADLWQAQTPQGFKFDKIFAAHQNAAGDETDDVALAEKAGLSVQLVEGVRSNFKITTAEDLAMARQIAGTAEDYRTGFGYDVHRFESGDSVTLCGVTIPHRQKLKGHSDADVGLHALMDALLGAIGEGDIGQHFPPSDEKWRGASSDIFLRHAAELIRGKGGRLVNADVTLICEAPKVGPHREAMRKTIAEILVCEVSRISVKATTTEKLGFTGREEGIAAEAVVSVALPRTLD